MSPFHMLHILKQDLTTKVTIPMIDTSHLDQKGKQRKTKTKLPLLAVNISIILPGVQTMISAPRFSSAI